MVTEKDLEDLEKKAIEMNGQGGVSTIVCQHCGHLVMSNYVPWRLALREYDLQQQHKERE